MSEFYMIFARKIFFPIFLGGVPPAPGSPTPMGGLCPADRAQRTVYFSTAFLGGV